MKTKKEKVPSILNIFKPEVISAFHFKAVDMFILRELLMWWVKSPGSIKTHMTINDEGTFIFPLNWLSIKTKAQDWGLKPATLSTGVLRRLSQNKGTFGTAQYEPILSAYSQKIEQKKAKGISAYGGSCNFYGFNFRTFKKIICWDALTDDVANEYFTYYEKLKDEYKPVPKKPEAFFKAPPTKKQTKEKDNDE